MPILKTFSSQETRKLGGNLGRRVLDLPPRKEALVLALVGDLGAGKTTFVQGFFKGLGLRRRAQSPTFILMRHSRLKNKKFKDIFHIDAYRLKSSKELHALEFKNLLSNPKNILLIEWADRISKSLPKKHCKIKLIHGAKENERKINISQDL